MMTTRDCDSLRDFWKLSPSVLAKEREVALTARQVLLGPLEADIDFFGEAAGVRRLTPLFRLVTNWIKLFIAAKEYSTTPTSASMLATSTLVIFVDELSLFSSG